MEEKIDYLKLYNVQDTILDAIFSGESTFYLTGGTCVNRFYNEKRYSDDLDFFSCDNNLFRQMIRTTFEIFAKKHIAFEIIVDTRDFIRLKAADILKVDFVNDRTYYYGKVSISSMGYFMDNPYNMLANKISAVMGRDEPKDVFDLFVLSACTDFLWNDIIDIALKKGYFDLETLEYRLKTFPVEMLDKLVIKDNDFPTFIKNNYFTLVNDIINGEQNSLLIK